MIERLKGSQKPTERRCPSFVYSDGEDAIEVLSATGLNLDKWQKDILIDWMGRDEEDKWAAPTCGNSIPRQNGKTLDAIGRMVAGAVMLGEWIIYTAHLQKTSSETFLEMKGVFESEVLSAYVKEIKSAIGREQIILRNGGRIVFVARTRNGGRGLHGDCILFDEAQSLTTEQQASFIPALAASNNPQTIYIGTPPDEMCQGTVFRDIREKALSGKASRIAWEEYSVKEIGDVTDRRRWAETNPALGVRILESTIEAECEQMPEDTFARERLGWWSPIKTETIDYAIDKTKWSACSSDELKPEGKTSYGVKFSADGAEVCLCGAVIPERGKPRISLISRKPTSQGIRWLSDFLNERYAKACCVVIDGKNGSDLLVDRIQDTWRAKGSVIKPSAKDIIAASSLLIDAINENNITWYKLQEDLDDSAKTSIKRAIAGGYGFGGANSLPIEACSLAFYGAKTTKRNPSRKMRVG